MRCAASKPGVSLAAGGGHEETCTKAHRLMNVVAVAHAGTLASQRNKHSTRCNEKGSEQEMMAAAAAATTVAATGNVLKMELVPTEIAAMKTCPRRIDARWRNFSRSVRLF